MANPKAAASSLGNPKQLIKELEAILEQPRSKWNSQILRDLWQPLAKGLNRRTRSVAHEYTWLYLAGFTLRPGYGMALDEFRVDELWQVYGQGIAAKGERQIEDQWWIMWRRVAGGLDRSRQERLFDKIFPALRKGRDDTAEQLMLAGSLERIDMLKKVKLGHKLVDFILEGRRQFFDQRVWALARIASRYPLYSGSETIVPPRYVEEWFQRLKPLRCDQAPYNKLHQFFSQSGRLVDDRQFDLQSKVRQEYLRHMERFGAKEDQLAVVANYVEFSNEHKNELFGEALPTGLRFY